MAFNVVTAEYVLDHLDDMTILDVRTPEEFSQGHIPHAINIDLKEVEKSGDPSRKMFSLAREKGIGLADDCIVYCRSGHRALIATKLLESQGFSRLHLYSGSWLDWMSDPSRPYEKPHERSLLELMKSGELYDCSMDIFDPELEDRFRRNKTLLYDFNLTRYQENEKRQEILREVFAEIGENCYIEPPLFANWGLNTHIGNNFYANFGLTLVDDTDIFIGDSVMIAPHVTLATASHPIDPELRAKNLQFNQPIHIGDKVWIGAGAIILPGVSIGEGSVIGAGSVVTKDIEDHVVAVGNPCRVIRKI